MGKGGASRGGREMVEGGRWVWPEGAGVGGAR